MERKIFKLFGNLNALREAQIDAARFGLKLWTLSALSGPSYALRVEGERADIVRWSAGLRVFEETTSPYAS